jgi:hypothetical protein
MAEALDVPARADLAAIAALRELAERWDRLRISYAVANGLNDYPRRLGRDIDVVVDRRHLQAASAAVRSTFERGGWRVVVRRRPELVQHVAISPNRCDCLIVDLFPGLRWGPVRLVERPVPSFDVDGLCIDPWASFVKRILLHVLVAPRRKFSGCPDRLQLSEAERAAVLARLPRLAGPALADRLLATVAAQDVPGLEALRGPLRKALIVSSARRAPFATLRTGLQWAHARLALATGGWAMPTVSVIGPDGVDTAAIVSEVARQAQTRLRCPYVVVRRQEPGILVQLGRSLMDRRISADLGLVVYQRSGFGTGVTWTRASGASASRRFLEQLLPKQDLVVVISRAPEDVRERTPPGHMALSPDNDPGATAERIVSRLVDRFLEKNGEASAA